MSVIQQVYFPKEKYSIYIKGIKPDEDDYNRGEITINGNPTALERKERYHIEGKLLLTDSYQIPIHYVIAFLGANGSTTEQDGKTYAVFKEIEFKLNNPV